MFTSCLSKTISKEEINGGAYNHLQRYIPKILRDPTFKVSTTPQ